MQKLAHLVLFLLLVSTIQAAETKDIKGMAATFTIKGTISVNQGNIIKVLLHMLVPQATDYQVINYPGRSAVDDNGNRYAIIEVDNPSNPFTYTITTTVVTKGRVTQDLPSSYSTPDDVVKYTSLTGRVQGDSPEIKEAAMNITANSTSNFERAAKLAIYVNKLVQYDLGYAGQWKDAVWVFENKRGVCIEYATLYAAMARSIGIPTRIIAGYVYDSSTNTMMGHAWDEVYLGKWVPVDPTWLEVGYLDGGHVEAARIIDNETPEGLAFIYSDWGAAVATFKSSTADPTYGSAVTRRGITYFENDSDYELSLTPGSVAPGGTATLELSVAGKEYRLANVKLVAQCGGKVSFNESEQSIILEENKTAKVDWVLNASKDIGDTAVRCQLSTESDYLDGKNATLDIVAGQQPEQKASETNQTASAGNTAQKGQKLIPCLPITILTTTLAAALLFIGSEKSRHKD